MLPPSCAYCLSLATEDVKRVLMWVHPLFSFYLCYFHMFYLGIGASLADHFHCICMLVGTECSACACVVLYIRSRQKASHIMMSNIINGKSEEIKTECCLALAPLLLAFHQTWYLAVGTVVVQE